MIDAVLPSAPPITQIDRSASATAEEGLATLRRLTGAAMQKIAPSSDRVRRGPGPVSQCLAAAAAGVRFRNLPASARLAVGAADARIRIAFEVGDDATIDDIQCMLQALVDEVQAMNMRDTPDGQGN